MSESSHESDSRRSRWTRALTILALAGSCVYWSCFRVALNPAELLAESRQAFTEGDTARALELAVRVLEFDVHNPDAAFLAGQAARQQNRRDDAVRFFETIPPSSSLAAVAYAECGNLLLEMGQAVRAETLLRRAIDIAPDNVSALTNLAFLFRIEGRNRELRTCAETLFQNGRLNRDLLFPLAAPEKIWLDRREAQFVDVCRSTVPADALAQFGTGRLMSMANQRDQAIPLFQRIVTDDPELLEVQAQLGSDLLADGSVAKFENWLCQLPGDWNTDPDIWFVRGQWALRTGNPRVAVRCFREAIVIDPNHRRALYQLAQTLAGLEQFELVEPLTRRFEQLDTVVRLVSDGDGSPAFLSPESMCVIAEHLRELGRVLESSGWCREVLRQSPDDERACRIRDELAAIITSETPLMLRESALSLAELADFPLPETIDHTASEVSTVAGHSEPSVLPTVAVAFRNIAESCGLHFQFINGADGHARMFEFSGGGVAALDYDQDSWPDLYFTQGCAWPPESKPNPDAVDRLFRNVQGSSFRDVTEQCGIRDSLYGQGPCAGDFNSDGFPDLLVANIGPNRLYRNNGDGTFADVTTASGIGGDEWTSSCVMADLDGDTFPDIYAVNYLKSEDVFDRRCDESGRPVQCSVSFFDAEQDRLFVNSGNEQFRDVTAASGIVRADGKGMGVIAADFDRSHRLSLFVANDTTPNFYLSNQTRQSGDALSLVEHGIERGVSLGASGESQSCMGAATEDINGDGLLDLVVTNFVLEPHNLYVQSSSHHFQDVALMAGLARPGTQVMGWGAQFVDANLDGHPDLIVANGHLDENTSGQAPFEMPVQYFHNTGAGRFYQPAGTSRSGYLSRPHIGRAVARLDWNRDGLDDVCVTHVTEPPALLTNETQHQGHYLRLRLIGVTSDRDAIGATVEADVGGRTLHRQLTAGDGFQACNERRLTIGLGSVSDPVGIRIEWPSGQVQAYVVQAVDTEWTFVEGRSAPYSAVR